MRAMHDFYAQNLNISLDSSALLLIPHDFSFDEYLFLYISSFFLYVYICMHAHAYIYIYELCMLYVHALYIYVIYYYWVFLISSSRIYSMHVIYIHLLIRFRSMVYYCRLAIILLRDLLQRSIFISLDPASKKKL